MPSFKVGDLVVLAPKNTGQKAFSVLKPGSVYQVEKTSPSCSSKGCSDPNTGTIRILGSFFCSECFVNARQAPIATGVASSGVQERAKDPARSLYTGEMDFYELLPDPTEEERRTLPSLEQLDDEWWKKRGYPGGSPTKKLP